MNDMDKLEQLVRLGKIPTQNHHLHTAIVVMDDRVVVIEGMVSLPLDVTGH